jgi:hypothetical protein
MRFLLAWLACMICMSAVPAFGQTSKQPFTITISAEAPALKLSPDHYALKAGSDLFIRVHLTNTSKHTMRLGDDDSGGAVDGMHRYEVRDDKGVAAERWPVQRAGAASAHPSAPEALKPGASADVASDRISGVFDVSQPGKYTIQLSRAIDGDFADGEVKSNAITVTVTAE